jgi:TonB-linked SusC/RagA family outer membrane protein
MRFTYLSLVLLFAGIMNLYSVAMEYSITGKVTDEKSGQPLVGVTVRIEGTELGTFTRSDGTYTINVPSFAQKLLFNYVGYETVEAEIGNNTVIDVAMKTSYIETDEIVVTALGAEREQRSLGYSVQEITGSSIAESNEANLVNSIQGRVAGVQITNGSSGAGSSSRIVIRGETSLNSNNQPLFVIDGIPINNETDNRTSSKGTADNMKIDFGNGAADINPEDIESMSVLKGPSATALYGSRAANGVILITTKKGRGQKGLGISFTSSAEWESLLIYPEYQDQYGQGKNFDFGFSDGYGGGVNDGVDESWGPKLDGRLIPQFDSPAAGTYTYPDGTTVQLRGGDVHGLERILGSNGVDLDRRGEITPTPFVYHGNPVEEFFGIGRTLQNTIAFSGGNDDGSFRMSFGNLQNEGIAPNTDYFRNNVTLSGTYDLSDKVKVEGNAQYINTWSNNRVVNGYGTESVMYLFTWYGMSVNTESLKDYWQRGLEGFQQFNYNNNYHDNPYFNMYENTNAIDKNRFLGNVSVKYSILDNLIFSIRSGVDFYNDVRTIKRAFSTQRFPKGQYREDKITFNEMNTDFLLNYFNMLGEDWNYSVSVGGNAMNQINNYHSVSNNQMVIPNVYTFANTDISLVSQLDNREKAINSLYGFGQIGWKNQVFLDVTARNDWSSTLPDANNSYFYPSASLSVVFSDLLNIDNGPYFNFGKLRLSLAQVGNDTDPYLLQNVWNFGSPFGDDLLADESSVLANPDLKPEIVTSWEIGADLRFLDSRVGLDVTYYNNISKNQIIGIPLPSSSGYSNVFINAGQISSNGLEISLNAVPVKLDNSFEWFVGANFSYDRSYVDELSEGIDQYSIMGNRVSIIAKEGERMGTMWGTGFKMYDPASNQLVEYVDGYATIEKNGERVKVNEDNLEVVFEKGLPVYDPTLRVIGNYNPDWMLGLQNSFKYKGFELGVLFDFKIGGEIYSETRLIAATSGNIVETLWGRDPENGGAHDGISNSGLTWDDGNGQRTDGVIGDGVMVEANGNIVENDYVVAASAYHNRRYSRGNETEGIYDASYVKLREVKLSYNFPKQWLDGMFIKNLRLSLIGRNLAIWTESPHFDPETVAFTGNRYIPGVEAHPLPSTRRFNFELNVGI